MPTGLTYTIWNEIPESPIRPRGKVMVVIEDQRMQAELELHKVMTEDGTATATREVERDGEMVTEDVVLHRVTEYDGTRTIPRMRRALIVATSDCYYVVEHRQVGFKTVKGPDGTGTYKQGIHTTHNRRVDHGLSRGDVVWYTKETVGHHTFEHDGWVFTFLGADQVEFVECPDDDPGGLDAGKIDWRFSR